MPLTNTETNIMNKMRSRYGKEKGERIFYSSANMGKLGKESKARHGGKRNLRGEKPKKEVEPDTQ